MPRPRSRTAVSLHGNRPSDLFLGLSGSRQKEVISSASVRNRRKRRQEKKLGTAFRVSEIRNFAAARNRRSPVPLVLFSRAEASLLRPPSRFGSELGARLRSRDRNEKERRWEEVQLLSYYPFDRVALIVSAALGVLTPEGWRSFWGISQKVTLFGTVCYSATKKIASRPVPVLRRALKRFEQLCQGFQLSKGDADIFVHVQIGKHGARFLPRSRRRRSAASPSFPGCAAAPLLPR